MRVSGHRQFAATPRSGGRVYDMVLSGSGAAPDVVAAGVLKPLNAKLGQQCFQLGASSGAEIAVNGRSGWMGSIGGDGGIGLVFGETFMRFLAFEPQHGKAWSWKQFNFDTDPPQMAAFSKVIDATNPDLTKLKKRGGKIIHYHGWADALVNPQMSVDYYESVLKKMGKRQTGQFYKLYMVPGMFHCAGGVGCDRADRFGPLVDWVEKCVVPNAIAGARAQQTATVMTRSHCPYPQTAKYKGSGGASLAENFTCQ